MPANSNSQSFTLGITMVQRIFWLSFCFLSLQTTLEAQAPIESVIRQVTLYRDQALVTREIKIPIGKGVREFIVRGLPSQVVLTSLFAESSGGIEVRGLRISQQESVAGDPVTVAQHAQEVTRLSRERSAAERRLQSMSKSLSYIDQLMNYSSSTAHQDLNRGVLNSQSLTELTGFAMKQRSELIEEQLKLETEIADLVTKQEKELVRETKAMPTNEVAFEVKLTIDSQNQKEGVVSLSYLVSGCGWTPKYAIHGSLEKTDFQVKYGAMVRQTTGENWGQVKLVLSTSSPRISAAGPSLNPFRVSLGGSKTGKEPNDPFGSDTQVPLQQGLASLSPQKAQIESEYASTDVEAENLQRDFALNSLASDVQNLELMAELGQVKALAPDSGDDVASQTYTLEQPVSLDSRNDPQLVQIFDAMLPGKLYHVATPLLSTFAYREADLLNQRSEGLLRGPAMIYLDNRFVGQTEIPSTASGQHLIVGFGADQQVRTRRELLEKTEDQKGGNRHVTFRYRLVVANFKSAPVTIRMVDRIPLPAQAAEVSLHVDSKDHPLSQDGLYRRIQYPRGILRWDLNVPAERFGEKAFDLEYTSTVEFDRNRVLTSLDAANQKRADLRELGPRPNNRSMGGGMGGMGGSNVGR